MRLSLSPILGALLLGAAHAQPPANCTADQDCLSAGLRCLPSKGGAPCTLDYAFNLTGQCACLPQACADFTYPRPLPGKKQWLVAGDSISLGYLGDLAKALGAPWQVLHVGGSFNCDSAYQGSRCWSKWLGPNASRWDVVSYNAGLHDLAYPDNEHLSVTTYAALLATNLRFLAAAARPDAALVWMRTTPVPTNPPANCTLIPGRLESAVGAYNAAADAVVAGLAGRVGSCDLHGVVDRACGAGYASCAIAQCGGPHFTAKGWALLGAAAAACGGAA